MANLSNIMGPALEESSVIPTVAVGPDTDDGADIQIDDKLRRAAEREMRRSSNPSAKRVRTEASIGRFDYAAPELMEEGLTGFLLTSTFDREKSALKEAVTLLEGALREAAAAGKGSFAWAWMLDERPEERARGVTVEVAMTRFETSGFEAGFAPPSGPGSIGGQTREHAQLARSLGISQLAVVGTKLDAISGDPEEQAARFAAVRGSLEPFLKSCGFASRAVQWLPASGVTGDNLRGRGDGTGLGAWWRGGTLEDAIDAFRPGSGGESERERALRLPLRLVVHEAAAAGSKGAAQLGGKLEAGALLPGSRVLVMPSGQAATVRTLGAEGAGGVAAGGSSPAALLAGSGASLTLAGLDDPGSVGPGSIVCDPAWPVPAASAFRARVLVLQVPGPILPGQQVSVYCHAAKESGTLRRLQQDGPSPRPARFLVSGQRALVEVALARPLALETAADLPALGRVVLRDGGRTLAVGLIIELL
ncbi:hypothetical protein APUTEX25_002621 [Auxenochlorella protothecoides]|uniref:GTP-eEF1A C-terminal domain-containing protein n=1 Tax=Auxenochlorella protothecoides TaxID=3075 RepID=A0A3M7KVZ9_AUXPR|nr:hypothetical protein APUTEX25_002621 [Auxenochlorella protothecoides]|eukprot:RMZ54044.1 hypothetical protein APUTEX25_002621 [Auxenochlorella protothecoides]